MSDIRLNGLGPVLAQINQAGEIYRQAIVNIPPIISPALLASIDSSWMPKNITLDIAGSFKFSELVRASLSESLNRLAMSEKILASIDLPRINLAMTDVAKNMFAIESSISMMTTAFRQVADSIPTMSEVIHMPEFVLPGATREIFTASLSLGSLRIPEQEIQPDMQHMIIEVENEVYNPIERLELTIPGIARPFIGAKSALDSDNPDKGRHVLISLREGWGHVLRNLATDQEVLEWIKTVDCLGLLHKHKPTRKARVKYICRGIDNGSLCHFVDKDTAALIELMDTLQHVHELNMTLSDQQLRALVLKSFSWVLYIFDIWEATTEHVE